MLRAMLLVSLLLAATLPPLPEQTSRYNRGGSHWPGRYRDDQGRVRVFALRHDAADVYDGGGRRIAIARQPVMLNVGAAKTMLAEGRAETAPHLWAWNTDAGVSGWVAADDLIAPPDAEADRQAAEARNPPPPKEAAMPLTIDSAGGTAKLTGLVHPDSAGNLPRTGGNRGEHYAGRNPGPRNYIYLLFATPGVQRGGVAKDSIPDGAEFAQGLDEDGQPIVAVVTMYRNADPQQTVPVTFIYGRAKGGDRWGWIARANVGAL